DITIRKRAEEELKVQQAFLRSVLDTVPSVIYVKDEEKRYRLVNRAFADFYGVTPEQMLDRTIADFNADPQTLEHFRALDEKVRPGRLPLRCPTVDADGPSRRCGARRLVAGGGPEAGRGRPGVPHRAPGRRGPLAAGAGRTLPRPGRQPPALRWHRHRRHRA